MEFGELFDGEWALLLSELVDSLHRPPKELYGDSAYDTDAIRGKLASIVAEANIPVNPRNGRGFEKRGRMVLLPHGSRASGG